MSDEKSIFNSLKKYPDLYRYSLRRSIMRLTASAIWYAFWTAVLYAHIPRLFSGGTERVLFTSAFLAVIFLFPFFVFKAHKLITDRSYSGVIKQIRKAYKTKPQILGSTSSSNLKARECIVFIVEDSSGKIHEYTYFEKDEIENTVYFKTGSRVIHYKEIKYLHNKDLKKNKLFCVLCCSLLPSELDICPGCRHTLIRETESSTAD